MPIELIPITRIPDEPQINTSGAFLAGTTALFTFTFADIEGVLFDPSDIDVTVLDSDGATVETGTKTDKLSVGMYVWDWDIPADQAPGLYSIRVDYVVEQPDGSSTEFFTESFVIGESDIEIIEPQIIAFRVFIESLIGYSQRIPVFHEIGRLNSDRTVANFTFPRWNQPAGSRIFINGNETTTGFSVDYLKGTVTFTDILATIDEIQGSYSFRWFTDGEIDAFAIQAAQVFNQYPPHSAYGLTTLPPRYGITVAHQAAVFALRRLIMDLHFQEPAKVFGGMERADRLTGSLNALKQNMEEEINKLYEQKKYQPYVGLTKTVTVPEFTLPGGRCISCDSILVYRVKNAISRQPQLLSVYTNSTNSLLLEPTLVYTNEKSATVKEVYRIFKSGSKIEVLSDNNGILSFETVSNIWNSGTKPLLRIEDEYDNMVEVSDEHIMFINEEEVPASEVKVGDCLTVNLFDSLQQSKVTKITNIKETPTFDLEVPTTENLIVNNIKCHNSRWFRYLFKGA